MYYQDELPMPLSRDEEIIIARRAKEGDKAARKKLIEHNLRLVPLLVKKYNSVCNTTDDLVSIGTIGLIRAVDTFDPESGNRFSTYAGRCITTTVLTELRKEKRYRRCISLNTVLYQSGEGGSRLELEMTLRTEPDEVSKAVEYEAEKTLLMKTIAALPEKQRQVIQMHFLQGFTQQQVANRLGLSQSYVSRFEKRTLADLKARIERVW